MENNKIFEVTAVWDEKSYQHFGIRPALASIYGDNVEDIETLKMRISDDQTIPEPNGEYLEADYWGWLDSDDDELSMIYPQRFLVEMCFPAGIKASEDVGQGKAYRLEVINEVK